MPSSPAWCLWLKGTGWRGASASENGPCRYRYAATDPAARRPSAPRKKSLRTRTPPGVNTCAMGYGGTRGARVPPCPRAGKPYTPDRRGCERVECHAMNPPAGEALVFEVNGRRRETRAAPQTPLLHVLRNDLGL